MIKILHIRIYKIHLKKGSEKIHNLNVYIHKIKINIIFNSKSDQKKANQKHKEDDIKDKGRNE